MEEIARASAAAFASLCYGGAAGLASGNLLVGVFVVVGTMFALYVIAANRPAE